MTPAASLILSFRRRVAMGVATRAGLGLLFATGLLILSFSLGRASLGAVLMAGAAGVYGNLAWRSVRASREAMSATRHLAQGDLVEAERLLTESLSRFSLHAEQRVVELYHLAVLRQGQRQFAEAAELAGAVWGTVGPTAGVGGRAGWKAPWSVIRRLTSGAVAQGADLPGGMTAAGAIGTAALLVRLEALLELDQLAAAHKTLLFLHGRSLQLDERIRLLVPGCRYDVAVGAWQHLLGGMDEKLKLADLMPGNEFAMVHVMLAMAARRLGRDDLGRWLMARGRTVVRIPIPAYLADWGLADDEAKGLIIREAGAEGRGGQEVSDSHDRAMTEQ